MKTLKHLILETTHMTQEETDLFWDMEIEQMKADGVWTKQQMDDTESVFKFIVKWFNKFFTAMQWISSAAVIVILVSLLVAAL